MSTANDTRDATLGASATPRRSSQGAWPRFRRHRLALIGLGILVVFSVMAVLAPWVSINDPIRADVFNIKSAPSRDHILGTGLRRTRHLCQNSPRRACLIERGYCRRSDLLSDRHHHRANLGVRLGVGGQPAPALHRAGDDHSDFLCLDPTGLGTRGKHVEPDGGDRRARVDRAGTARPRTGAFPARDGLRHCGAGDRRQPRPSDVHPHFPRCRALRRGSSHAFTCGGHTQRSGPQLPGAGYQDSNAYLGKHDDFPPIPPHTREPSPGSGFLQASRSPRRSSP